MQQKSRTVIYVDGTFDLFHSGHVEFLKRAKKYGNYLIVGVLDDDCVESYKYKPVLNLRERARFMQSVRIIDEIIAPAPFLDSRHGNLTDEFLDRYMIDYVVYSGSLGEWAEHYRAAIKRGIMKTFPYGHDELSSSEITRRVLTRGSWFPK